MPTSPADRAETRRLMAWFLAKMDAEVRKKLNIGGIKAEVPEVPAAGPAEAKEVVRGRKG